MKSFKICFLSASLFLTLTQCGDGSSNSIVNAALEGDWVADCLEDTVSGDTSRYKDEWTFSSTDFERTVSIFSDSDELCEDSAKSVSLYTGTFSQDDTNALVTLDLTVDSAQSILESDDLVTSLNNLSVCSGNWTKGSSKVLTKSICESVPAGFMYSSDTVYDVYQIIGNQMSFGTLISENTRSESARPSQIHALSALDKN